MDDELCAIHGRERVVAVVDGRRVSICPSCALEGGPDMPNDRRRRAAQPKLSESDVQRSIVEALEQHGFEVMQTSRHWRGVVDCSGQRRYSARGDGVTRGLADLVVRDPRWPRAVWVQIEVKAPGGAASEAQWRNAQRNGCVIVTGAEEALVALRELSGVLGVSE